MNTLINGGSKGSGSDRSRNDFVWDKGLRRVPLDGKTHLVESEHTAGPRLFIKHYPDGRADEYVYADAGPLRTKLPLIIVAGAFCSLLIPMLGRFLYEDLTTSASPLLYVPTMIAIVVFLTILTVLFVKYFKGKDIIFEEIPAGADPREKGKNYSGNFSGKAAQREMPLYNEQFVPKRIFSTVSLIPLIVLMAAGLTSLAVGIGMMISPEADNGYGVFFIILGGFWILMSLIGSISSISSLVNANKMKKKLPPPPAAKSRII